MIGEAAKKNLYDAATNGEVARFRELVEEDTYILEEVSFSCSRNVLHIATMRAQVSIVEEVLRINPELARDLDSKMSSSLHIAAARGSIEMPRKLLSTAPEMLWVRDCHDMNPIHIAAMGGHVETLEVLLRTDLRPAMERLPRGQTMLHLCVKHGRLRALQVLVENLGDLVDARDDDGDTILHLAVRFHQFEIIRYLVDNKKIEELTQNSMGKTATGILNKSSSQTTNDKEIEKMLISLLYKEMPERTKKMNDMNMVVVILIATMAFQAAVSPPGGVWQEDTLSHKAGQAVMAYTHLKLYKYSVRSNTIAFVSSIITIMLNCTGLPFESYWLLMVAWNAMWFSLGAIVATYRCSLTIITPNKDEESLLNSIDTCFFVSATILGILNVWYRLRQLYSSWKIKARRYEDVTTHYRIVVFFYSIFRAFESWKYSSL